MIEWNNTMKRGAVTELLQKTYKEAAKTRLDWSTEIPPFFSIGYLVAKEANEMIGAC